MIAALLDRLLGPRLATRLSPWLVFVALAVSAYFLGSIFHAQTKLETWLFWRYAGVWACSAVFIAACYSVGNWLVSLLSEPGARGLGHVTLSFATGVFAFFWLTAIVGFAGGLDGVSFVLIPVALFAAGARKLLTDLRALRDRARSDPGWLALKPNEVAAFAVGFAALGVIYLGVLVPENASYDARWYHMAVAEHYAAAGGIIRSVEGNLTVTVPQLASILFTWAFCLPWGDLFDRFELAIHLEFVIFVLTLPGIVALVRYLVPGTRALGAWVVMFAFPSVFIYDSALHGGADHIAALWTIPTYLSLVRAFAELRWRSCLLFAISVSGILMCKYTALAVVVGPVLVLTLRGLQLGIRQLRQRPRRAPAIGSLFATLFAGLLLTTPHWLKNLVWHGDPVYPILHKYLPVRPWNADGDFLFAVYQEQQFVPTGTLQHKLVGMFKALVDHSYALYNWSDFHGNYPVFGSLFTFGLVALPFLRGTRRAWALVALTHVGIVAWYWLSNAERYLQSLLPWMVSVVAALGILAWRSGWPARLGVIGLAGLQVVWGMDMIFWPLHRMTGKSGIGLANDFFARGYKGPDPSRTQPFEDYAVFGRGLPRDAKVLVHHDHLHLGLGTMVVSDSTRMAYGLNYGELGSPAAVHHLLRSYGVTHVLWQPQVVHGDESVAGDLVFHDYAQSWRTLKRGGGRKLAALPTQAPPPRNDWVIFHQCDGSYPPGLYRLADLRLSPYSLRGHVTRFPNPRAPLSSLEEQPVRPSYAVVNDKCPGAPPLKDYGQVAAAGSIRYLSLK